MYPGPGFRTVLMPPRQARALLKCKCGPKPSSNSDFDAESLNSVSMTAVPCVLAVSNEVASF